jgi:hypothetical protein
MVSRRWAAAALAGMVAVVLQGCGGGDEEEARDADAAGLYQGSMLLDGTTRNFVVAVAPDGTFAGGFGASTAGAGNSRVLFGTGVADGNAFSATGTAFAPQAAQFTAGGTVAALTISNGIIDEGVRLQGAYAAGGESGNFTVDYRTEMTQRGALLSRIAGTYDSYPPAATPAQNLVMTIDSSGAFTLATTGCTGTGQISILDADVNVYSVQLSPNGCLAFPTYTGIASLEDAEGGTNNRLILFVATPTRSASFGYGGLRR